MSPQVDENQTAPPEPVKKQTFYIFVDCLISALDDGFVDSQNALCLKETALALYQEFGLPREREDAGNVHEPLINSVYMLNMDEGVGDTPHARQMREVWNTRFHRRHERQQEAKKARKEEQAAEEEKEELDWWWEIDIVGEKPVDAPCVQVELEVPGSSRELKPGWIADFRVVDKEGYDVMSFLSQYMGDIAW